MGSASVISVEEQLREAGMMLLTSPSSVDELLIFLDRAEELLCNIEQAPSISVKEALFPMMKALKADTLLKHADVDVQVSVASCIHEITRITAPKEPYNDDLMKEIFKLTVSALENLSQPSTRCYKKAASIIYTTARVRSFLVMVDLECDALIVEMFEHFLKHARLNHSEDVLWAMEQIMTIILDESEYISFKLLRPLLASVRKENQNVSPISWELGNRVISKCASKLRPFVGDAVESMDAEVDDFAPIIAKLCQSSVVTREQNHAKDSKEPVVELTVTLQELGSGSDPAPKSTSDDLPGQLPKDDATSTFDSKGSRKSGLEAVAAIERKRRRRPNSMMKPDEGYDEYWAIREKTSTKIPRRRNSHSQNQAEETNLPSNTDADLVVKLEANGHEDHKSWLVPSDLLQLKVGDNASENSSRNKDKVSKWQAKQQTSSRKRRKDLIDNLEGGLLTGGASVADKVVSDVAANNKIEEKAPLKSKVFSEDECRSEGSSHMSKSQARKQSYLKKRGKATSRSLDVGLHIPDASMFDSEISEVATNKISKLVGNKVSSEGRCSSKGMRKMSNLQGKKQSTERNRRKAAVVNLEKGSQDTSSMDKEVSGVAANKIMEKKPLRNKVSSGDECRSEGTPTTDRSLKRKANKEEESGQCYSVEETVGRRIRVWWPLDKKYYEGFVQSYDYKKKRYLVVYTDGDVERLNLPKKRWEFIEEENNSTPPRKSQNAEVPEYHDKQPSHGQIQNLKRNTSKSIKDTNPYQLVKRSGASSSALRLEAADGSVGSQPPIVVKVEDYINSDDEDSEATISETETTLSETTL